MPEVASATISVTPVLEGAQQTLTKQMTDAADPAGAAAGKSAGTSMMSSMGEQMSSVGGTMTKTVTAPIAAIGTAAVAAWKEVDTGFDTIIQKTGASGEELESMRDILSNVATSIPTDFATAGEAIGEVNTRFGLTGDALEDLSGKFIKFADLNGQDVSGSIDSVSKMMAAMGVETEDAGRMLDALNTVGQQTGVDVGYLADAVASNAAQFKEMGLTAEDSVALLGEMSMAGLDSSTAMMGLKTAMKNATEDGVSMQDSLAGFADIMNSNMSESDKLAAAYETFGTRAGAAIYNAVSNGTLDLDNFTSSLGEFEGSVDETFEATQDPIDSFTTVLNQLKDLGSEIVETAGPMLSDMLEGVSGAVQKLADVWEGLPPEMQDTIEKVAVIAAVIGPLLIVGGKLMDGIGKITGGFGDLIGKIGGIGGAAGDAAGPVATAGTSFGELAGGALKIIAVAAGIAIAAYGIKLLADAAVEVSSGGPATIGTFFGMAAAIGVLMAVAAALGPALDAGALGFLAFGGAMLGIGEGINLACQGIATVIEAVCDLTEVIAENADGINSVVSNLGETVGGVFESIGNAIATVVDAIGGAISGVFDSLANVIESVGDSAKKSGEGFQMFVDALKDLVNNTSVFDLASTLAAVADGIKDINKEVKKTDGSAENINTLSEALGTLGEGAQSAVDALTTFTDTADNAFDTVCDGAESMSEAFSKSKDNIGMAFDSIRDDLVSAESEFASFSDGAISDLDKIYDAANDLDIAGAINTVMDHAQSTAQQRITDLQSLFANAQFNFNQYVALPHFSMSGGFNASTGEVPTISVQWYERAAELGARFTTPQIIGVGDASQPELLIGEERLKELVSGGQTTYNITVNGAENPEMWAKRLVRAARQYERIM